jgi:hypothetical protein
MRFLMPAVMLWAVVGLPGVALAYDTGNDLLKDLQASDSDATSHLFNRSGAYVVGVAQSLVYYEEIALPHGVTKRQTRDTVRVYLEAHPAMRHEPAFLLVRQALMEAFPSRTK